MNLFFRLIWLSLVTRWRTVVPALGPCRTPFRVLPTDLDLLCHVNNGVYLSMMDLARVDFSSRAGVSKPMRARGWYGVIVAETIRFRRPLTLLQRFEIETRVLAWDERAFLLEQRFFRGDDQIAHALVRARFLSRDGAKVTPRDVLALGGSPSRPPDPPEWVARWNAEQSASRGIEFEPNDTG